MIYKNGAGYTYTDYLAVLDSNPLFPRVDEDYWTASSKLTDLFTKEAAGVRGEDEGGLIEEELAEKQELLAYLTSRADYFESLTAAHPAPDLEYTTHETRPMWRQVEGAEAGVMERNPEYGVAAANGLFPAK